MRKTMLVIGGAAGVMIPALAGWLEAAELPLPAPRAENSPDALADRGPCGCLPAASPARDRGPQSTYGPSFDPRNYDQTEPYYYPGRPRAHVRYFVEGCSISHPC